MQISYRFRHNQGDEQGPYCSLCLSIWYNQACFQLDHLFTYTENEQVLNDSLKSLIDKYGTENPFRSSKIVEVQPDCVNPKCKAKMIYEKAKQAQRQYVINPPLESMRKQRIISGLEATEDLAELYHRIDALRFEWRCRCGFRPDDQLSFLKHIINEEHLTTNCTSTETAIDHIEKLVKSLRFESIKNMARTARNKTCEVDDSTMTFKIKEPETRTRSRNSSSGSSTQNNHRDSGVNGVKPTRVPINQRITKPKPDTSRNVPANTSRPQERNYRPKTYFFWNPTALPLMCKPPSNCTTHLLKGNEVFREMETLKKISSRVDRAYLETDTTLILLFNQNACHICEVEVVNNPVALLDHVIDEAHVKRISEVGVSREEIKSWITKIENCPKKM